MKFQVVFQTADPNGLAAFWRTALHYVSEPPPSGFSTWEEFADRTGVDLSKADIDSAIDPGGHGPRLFFERIDQPTIGDAVHLDINAATREQSPDEARSTIDAEAARLEAAGATTVKIVSRKDRYWVEMTDPDGNWFCVQ